MLKKNMRHWWLLGGLLLLLVTVVQAQGNRTLVPGTPLTGTLDEKTLAQVYTLESSANEVVTIFAQNQNQVALALVLTDASGQTVAQAFDQAATGQVSLTNATLTQSGPYFVTVFKAGGVQATGTVDFTLQATVGGTAAPEATVELTTVPTATSQPATVEATQTTFGTGQLLTTSGLTVALTWATTDDLDLEVRDPVGGSLYWETPTVQSGGVMSRNINQGCTNTTADSPTETATWSPGGIPTGSYEVLVYFQKSCSGAASVPFTIATAVDGNPLDPVKGSLTEGHVFVASFIVNSDGTSELTGLSGVVTENLPDDANKILSSAQSIQIGTSVTGTITDQQSYQAYVFDGQANDLVTIDMNANSGSLDTFLFLLDASGSVIASNDDRVKGNTDAEIVNALLPTAGKYTIVATRYAKRIGGTEGTYTLTVASASAQLPAEFANLPRGSLEMRLLWNTNADLQLQVRDPAGNTVYNDSPQIRSGGRLAAQGNINCRGSQGTPYSYIYWPTDTPPRPGSYEVVVWFQNNCGDTSPVTFNLYITYNGQTVKTVTVSPLLDDHYLISFTITADNQVVVSDGGIITGAASLNYQSNLENAVVIQPGEPHTGTINQNHKYDLYVFTGQAGEVVNISMVNTSGALDPSLYLMSAAGDQVAANDDAVVGENTNSLISNLTLPADGQYIIIATHYGAQYGGTSGTYSLTLTKLN